MSEFKRLNNDERRVPRPARRDRSSDALPFGAHAPAADTLAWR